MSCDYFMNKYYSIAMTCLYLIACDKKYYLITRRGFEFVRIFDSWDTEPISMTTIATPIQRLCFRYQ